jgi:hypothetical protein
VTKPSRLSKPNGFAPPVVTHVAANTAAPTVTVLERARRRRAAAVIGASTVSLSMLGIWPNLA